MRHNRSATRRLVQMARGAHVEGLIAKSEALAVQYAAERSCPAAHPHAHDPRPGGLTYERRL